MGRKMASRLPNIDGLSLADLNELQSRINRAIQARKDEAKVETLQKLKALAVSEGFSLDELSARAMAAAASVRTRA